MQPDIYFDESSELPVKIEVNDHESGLELTIGLTAQQIFDAAHWLEENYG